MYAAASQGPPGGERRDGQCHCLHHRIDSHEFVLTTQVAPSQAPGGGVSRHVQSRGPHHGRQPAANPVGGDGPRGGNTGRAQVPRNGRVHTGELGTDEWRRAAKLRARVRVSYRPVFISTR